jgi:hypothetical protein
VAHTSVAGTVAGIVSPILLTLTMTDQVSEHQLVQAFRYNGSRYGRINIRDKDQIGEHGKRAFMVPFPGETW